MASMLFSSFSESRAPSLHEELGVPREIDRWLIALNPRMAKAHKSKQSFSSSISFDKRIATIIACREFMADIGDVSKSFRTEISGSIANIKRYHPKKRLKAIHDLPLRIYYLEHFLKVSFPKKHKNFVQAEVIMNEKIKITNSELQRTLQDAVNAHAVINDGNMAEPNRQAAMERLSEFDTTVASLKTRLNDLQHHLEIVSKNKKKLISHGNFLNGNLKIARIKLEVLTSFS